MTIGIHPPTHQNTKLVRYAKQHGVDACIGQSVVPAWHGTRFGKPAPVHLAPMLVLKRPGARNEFQGHIARHQPRPQAPPRDGCIDHTLVRKVVEQGAYVVAPLPDARFGLCKHTVIHSVAEAGDTPYKGRVGGVTHVHEQGTRTLAGD